jgi:hypothetical protein
MWVTVDIQGTKLWNNYKPIKSTDNIWFSNIEFPTLTKMDLEELIKMGYIYLE